MIVIVDYGMGNLRSVVSKFHRLGVQAISSSNVDLIEQADKIVLPGVGFFAKGMENLRSLNLIGILNDKVVHRKTPVLGICLGMQLLTKRSEEGDADGLGWIDAETVKMKMETSQGRLRIPHMGWNSIRPINQSPITAGLTPDNRFYFVHSYHVCCNDIRDVVGTTEYGMEFTSIVQRGNIFGTQFHPEKSHSSGMAMLQRFVELDHV